MSSVLGRVADEPPAVVSPAGSLLWPRPRLPLLISVPLLLHRWHRPVFSVSVCFLFRDVLESDSQFRAPLDWLISRNTMRPVLQCLDAPRSVLHPEGPLGSLQVSAVRPLHACELGVRPLHACAQVSLWTRVLGHLGQYQEALLLDHMVPRGCTLPRTTQLSPKQLYRLTRGFASHITFIY